uniref:Uncharacterized protein n=1 Tax=Sphaerodactylus townsendi TaxID=933632 RepID=A0ACB8E597_9SAUR
MARCRALRLLLWLLLLGAGARAGAAPPCSSGPPSAEWVQGLARRASVVLEGQVLPRSGGEEATPPPPPAASSAPSAAAAAAAAASFSGSSSSSSPSPAARPPSPLPSSPPWGAGVRVHQVWPSKSGGLRKDSRLRVLLAAEPGSACRARLKEGSRYIFFLEPDGMSNASASPSLLPPLFHAASPPLETDGQLQQEVGRALCPGGECGKCISILASHCEMLGFTG